METSLLTQLREKNINVTLDYKAHDGLRTLRGLAVDVASSSNDVEEIFKSRQLEGVQCKTKEDQTPLKDDDEDHSE